MMRKLIVGNRSVTLLLKLDSSNMMRQLIVGLGPPFTDCVSSATENETVDAEHNIKTKYSMS